MLGGIRIGFLNYWEETRRDRSQGLGLVNKNNIPQNVTGKALQQPPYLEIDKAATRYYEDGSLMQEEGAQAILSKGNKYLLTFAAQPEAAKSGAGLTFSPNGNRILLTFDYSQKEDQTAKTCALAGIWPANEIIDKKEWAGHLNARPIYYFTKTIDPKRSAGPLEFIPAVFCPAPFRLICGRRHGITKGRS
jgi:hypothetical protein